MYSPAIIATEQAFQLLPSGSDRFDLVLPLHSFSEGAPFLVEISPCSGLGPIDLNTYEQDSSLFWILLSVARPALNLRLSRAGLTL